MRHTSFKIGGPAFCWLETEGLGDILEAVLLSENKCKDFIVLGMGSNILARDEGFDGVVMHLGGGFDYIDRIGEGVIKVGAGFSLAKLVNCASEWGLSGCEFLSGIPGDFGGAVFMNAGVRSPDNPEKFIELKDIIQDVDVFDLKDKEKKTLRREQINFNYRESGLDGMIVLAGSVRLRPGNSDIIIDRMRTFTNSRSHILNIGFPSAGSIFKNPDRKNPAGRLIEECGLKGKRAGGAEISRIHANVIVNVKDAKASDVLELIELSRLSVSSKFGINLELELKII